jgi:hypothetical protein
MFGYVLPEKPELKIREYELFRAYYCGVCKSIGSRHGNIQRLTLNYDSTFLALLLSSLAGEKTDLSRERCIAHPLSKRIVVRNSSEVEYASDINVILAYYNFKDKWIDDRSAAACAALVVLKHSFNKIRKRYAEKCDIIESKLKKLDKLEKGKCDSMDRAAEPFAKLMEEIVAYKPVCADESTEKILRWFGYNLGKWIYILDAFDDLEENIRNKKYNPLIYQYNYAGGCVNEFKDEIRQRVQFNLTYALSQLTKAYELLRLDINSNLIENIIYMGMLRKTEIILGIGSCRKVEESI